MKITMFLGVLFYTFSIFAISFFINGHFDSAVYIGYDLCIGVFVQCTFALIFTNQIINKHEFGDCDYIW